MLSALVAALHGCGDANRTAGQTDSRRAAEVDAMTAKCVEAMVRSTCSVMVSPPPGPEATVVFIAGVGPVDAQAYRALRQSGDAMCALVRSACASDWESAQCKTARGLWPGTVP